MTWPTSMPSSGRKLQALGSWRSAKRRMLACARRRAALSSSLVASQASRISSAVTRRGWLGELVEAGGDFAEGLVAALAYVGEDGADGGIDLGGVDGAALLQLLDGSVRAGFCFAEGFEGFHCVVWCPVLWRVERKRIPPLRCGMTNKN